MALTTAHEIAPLCSLLPLLYFNFLLCAYHRLTSAAAPALLNSPSPTTRMEAPQEQDIVAVVVVFTAKASCSEAGTVLNT